jgi:hypothetical protein
MKKSRLLDAVCTFVVFFSSASAIATPIMDRGTWEATLIGRDLNGNLFTFEAYYDTVLNITWLVNADYAGSITWTAATSWAAGVNPYGSGILGWQLPTVTDTGTSGFDYAYTGTDCGYNVQTGSAATTIYSEV